MSFCRFSQNFTEELMNGRSQEEPLWLDILPYLTLSPVRPTPPPPAPTFPILPCIKVGMTLCKHG